MVIERVYAGAAEATVVNGTMSASVPGTGQTFVVNSAAGYPVSDPFVVVIDRGEAGEEKILISSRSSTTFTVATRGFDDTTAQAHADQASCELAFDAAALNLLVDHVDGVEADPHSTKLLNNTRHDVEARHQFGSGLAFGVPSTPTALTPDIAGAAGTGNNPAREDHAHNVPAATAVTSGLANAEGTSGSFARADHTHDQAALSVDTPELVDLAVETAKINDLAVTSDKLAANSVIAGKVAAGAISETADIANGVISLAKLVNEDPTNFDSSVTFTNPTGNFVLGTGGAKTARYFAIGKLRLMFAHFTLGTGGNITAGADIEVSLPTANNANFRGFCAARARTASNVAWSGTGVIAVSGVNAVNFATAGSNLNWGSTEPFNWDAGDSLDVVLVWVVA